MVDARVLTKARLLGALEIKGKPVSFFSPPHTDPDFLWVDIEELARVFLPDDGAKRMVQHTHGFNVAGRKCEMAVSGDRLVTIVPHPMAQGFCAFIDKEAGHIELTEDEWNLGPANLAYTRAFADAHTQFMPMGFAELFAAYRNQGGPFLEGDR